VLADEAKPKVADAANAKSEIANAVGTEVTTVVVTKVELEVPYPTFVVYHPDKTWEVLSHIRTASIEKSKAPPAVAIAIAPEVARALVNAVVPLYSFKVTLDVADVGKAPLGEMTPRSV
jgi:hypothetical protein